MATAITGSRSRTSPLHPWSVDDGYPTYIQRHWPGFWSHDIDAAMSWPKDGKFYFFRDDECIACEPGKHEAAAGYPKKISERFPHLPVDFQSAFGRIPRSRRAVRHAVTARARSSARRAAV